MIILPAIDLIDKTPVRLLKGQFDTAHVVADSALKTAQSFADHGAKYLHVVDLDGARKGSLQNVDVAEEIKNNMGLKIEYGGGVRDMNTVGMLLDKGMHRVILGSAALKNKQLVIDAAKRYGRAIAVGIDAKDGFVSTEGWMDDSSVNYIEFAKQMEDIGVGIIIFTDISRDGTLTGPNISQLKKLQDAVSCDIVASGGIKDMEDIKTLKGMNLYGAIAGKALYSGNLNLKDALQVAHA